MAEIVLNKAPFYLVLTCTRFHGWRWSARGNNHEKMAQSQGYASPGSMKDALEILFNGVVYYDDQDGTLETPNYSIPILVHR